MAERHIEFIARGILQRSTTILACRNVAKGYYYLPGGHLDFGESPARSVEREFLEETGLRVVARDCLLVCETRFEQGDKARQEVNVVFHVEPAPGTDLGRLAQVPSLEPDIAFEWIDMARLAEIDLRPDVIRAWIMSSDRLPHGQGIDWLSHPPHS